MNSLIKSDGGTGPVKSGNLHLQGANSRSESWQMRESELISVSSFVFDKAERGEYEKIVLYQ